MNCESFKSWIWCLLFVGHLLVKGFQWKLFTWYHTNLVVSTKQELGFFLFHFLCLSSSSRGAFDQATCVTSDAESWQTETLSIRFENLTWGTEKWKQCHRPHVWPHHSNWATVVAPNCLGVVLFHQLFSCEQEIPSCSLENPNWFCRHWRCAFCWNVAQSE